MPQVSLVRVLIMLNGKPPRPQLLQKAVEGAQVVIGADAGAAKLLALGFPLHYLVGDLDSVPADLLQSLQQEQVIHDPGQDDTDLEKALRFAVTRWEQPDIVVVGTTGDRLDHVLGNVCGAVHYVDRASIRFLEDHSITYFGHNRVRFEALKGTVVSLLPLGDVRGVSTNGLKWRLQDETLSGTRGISNVVQSSPVDVQWQAGSLVIIRLLQSDESFDW